MKGFAVVIPAFNEAATIRDVATRALALVPDLIVVDDASTDGTARALDGLPITLLANVTNQGKAASIWRAAETALAAGASGIVTIDGDGQHDPADLPRILRVAAARPGAIVIGSRLHASDMIPKARYRANRFANFWVSWAAGRRIADTQSGFRAYPAEVFRRLDVSHGRWSSFVFESEVLIAAARDGMDIVCTPVSVKYATGARASHFRPVADIGKITLMVTRRLLASGFNLPGLWRSLRKASGSPPDAEVVVRYRRKP